MKRILIANRGEIACRILRTCKRLGFETVAVYSEADAAALHVALADHAVPIGAPPPAQSYLLGEKIVEAARAAGADAIHPGYGFLSENEDFARLVDGAGVAWIGPDARRASRTWATRSAPVYSPKQPACRCCLAAPASPPGDTAGLERAAREVGFPLLVKASAGGGGIGMRRVDKVEDLAAAVESTQTMAARAFGDGTVYLERYIAEARHVEVQVFGFGDGRAIHLYERDCSIQRRFQKIIEESPAPGLPAATREAMCAAAVALCAQQRYRGAGTIEFVLDTGSGRFYFLEMNTRIQVEHPVTEMVTGLDLVELQIRPRQRRPAGPALAGRRQGFGPCPRMPASTPSGRRRASCPRPGLLSRFDVPAASPQVRIDTGVRAGDRITHFYDPMIAKVIV